MTHEFVDIREVDFGKLDSESDPNLAAFFLDTGVVDRIARGQRKLVLGRKGSGKTAIFREAKIPGTHIIRLDFESYAWDAHKAIRELGMNPESAYVASWIFTFLVAACREWMKSPKANVRDAAQKIHTKIYGADEGGMTDILIDRAKRLRRLDLPNAGDVAGLGGVEFQNQAAGTHLARAANAWNEHLIKLAEQVMSDHPVSIFIDRLDDGWDATEEMMLLLAGAIKAARSLNIRFQERMRTPVAVIFLRSDIYRFVKFNDKAKMNADIERIEWTNDALIEIASKRIAESCPVAVADAWSAVYSTGRMRQGTTIAKYMLKRTMRRPRDLIAFCIACQDAARAGAVKVATSAEVYAGERTYSEHVHGELVDEMHKQIPDVDNYFAALNRIGYSKFNAEHWAASVKHVSPECNDPSVWLQELYKYAVVGIPKVGGNVGGSKVEFIYDTAFPQNNFTGYVVVHPALIKHLGLKEGSPTDATPVQYDESEANVDPETI